MPIGPGGNASGDVTVLEEGGKYYMCCTGGGIWVSDNLLDWEFHAVEHIPVAPDLVKYKGRFYLTGNTDHVYVADHPLGPYTDLGLFKNTGPVEQGWNGGFDTKIYVDDDGQPYLFWPGSSGTASTISNTPPPVRSGKLMPRAIIPRLPRSDLTPMHPTIPFFARRKVS